MKKYKILKQPIIVILLSVIPSCDVLPKVDPSLAGKIYINKQTQDRIEFTKKGTVVITWSSDEWVLSDGSHFYGYPKDYPHEFSYTFYDGGRKMTVYYLSSAQSLHFPYKLMEISDLKDRIIVTRMDGLKEEFKKE